jgi:hypothetical protein
MNEPETRTEAAPDFAVEDLQDELQALRTLMSVTLIVMIVFSICVNWYFFKQDRVIQGNINQVTQTAGNMQAGIVGFWNELNDFGKTHPDFAPVLDKYRSLFASKPALNARRGRAFQPASNSIARRKRSRNLSSEGKPHGKPGR